MQLYVALATIIRRFMASNIQKTDVIRQKATYNIRFYDIILRLMLHNSILDAVVNPQGL